MLGWNWFESNFQWIGGAAGVVLLIVLFCTTLLRADPSQSRWRDHTWLSWMGLAAYLLHNIEEYGIDLYGRLHSFPQAITELLNLPPYPDSPIPPLYFVAVNVTAFWVAFPIASLLSRRHPLVGLSVYSIIMVNIIFHVLPLAILGYNAGALTAVVIFVPLSIWIIRTCFGPGRMSYGALAFLIGSGIIFHVLLAGPLQLLIRGMMDATPIILLQVANPFLLMLILWLGEKWNRGALVRPLKQCGKASAAAR